MTDFQQPQMIVQQPNRMDLANMMQNQPQNPDMFGNINRFMQGQVMNKLSKNKQMLDMGMNNDFGTAGMPVEQWRGMGG